MPSPASIQVRQTNDTFLVTFTGALTEISELPEMSMTTPESTIILELQDLSAINSSGIRDFMVWINKIKAKVLIAQSCPKIFIDQANMIKGFLPANCYVQSFYVPFFNPTTEIETAVLYKQGVNYFLNQGMIDIAHPNLTEFELDVDETRYFAFLKEHCR